MSSQGSQTGGHRPRARIELCAQVIYGEVLPMTPDIVQGGSAAGGGESGRSWYRWQDWVNLIIGIWLFIAPWVVRTAFANSSAASAASWNSWVLGVIVFIMALWALSTPGVSVPEWINVLAGIWLFIAPWVLTFYSVTTGAAWNQWVFGVIVFILSVWAVSTLRPMSGPAGTHAPHAT